MSQHPSRKTLRAFRPHDHAKCVDRALPVAEAKCEKNGVRLTELRRRVLEILLESHKALGAYDILDRLRAEGRPAQPPIAYRALDFLVEQGFAHKVEGMSAFIACTQPDEHRDAALLICRSCKTVAELPATAGSTGFEQAADTLGFSIERARIEIEGLCPGCSKS